MFDETLIWASLIQNFQSLCAKMCRIFNHKGAWDPVAQSDQGAKLPQNW